MPAPNTATTVEDVNKSSDSAFKIPITNPVTGALHVIEGGLGEGLKGLTDTAQSALEQAVQIPVKAHLSALSCYGKYVVEDRLLDSNDEIRNRHPANGSQKPPDRHPKRQTWT